ncbi:telomerase reverse transcriptase isoform X2 [Oryza glaberrima]|uniref:telomerase reverse transcriptase isoform X2 n=1 Tax=Oryza glaberrima TaxID=4538 RepID=UPI00224C58FA|nr:telomerase reverse transcriptase isoform X2 [Oryza glaberrima]
MPRWRRRRVAPGGQVPPELRLAYGARALTLGRAVFSLLPSPRHRESPCPACRGRVASGCLACRRWEHLLRDGDPVAYRRLITRAVCAIAADDLSAPPPPRYTPGNSGHSQARLVREMMKSIVADQSHGTKNVLCNGLHEGGQSICISDLVSSSSWSILLHRIGDLLMCYLLRCTSIFLPVKKNDYFQVSGVPLNVVLRNPIFASTVARKHQPQTTKAKCHTCYLWKSANMAENISICHDSSNSGVNSSFSSTCKIVTQQSCETCDSIRRAESKDPSEGCNCPKFPSDGRSGECCNCYTHNTRKRKRLYSWQRRSKKKQVCSVDDSSAEWSKLNGSNFNMSNGPSENLAGKMNDQAQSVELTVDNTSLARSNDDSSSEIKVINATILSSEKSPCSVFDIRGSQGLSCHYSLSEVQYQSTCPQVGPSSYLHLNSCSICFNCIISNASKHLSLDSLISRNGIFYNRRTTYSVFHCKHILSKRKRPDALSLVKHIFGINSCCASLLKYNCHESTIRKSNCLCCWLPKSIKNLIRNSKRCQYKKLFLKHCSVKCKVAPDVTKNDGKAHYSPGGKAAYYDRSFSRLEAYSTHQQVASFVWAVLKRIVPKPLLGNSFGKRSLRTNIWKFIKLRRFETFQLSDCIGDLKVSHYSWLSNIEFSNCFCSAIIGKQTGSSTSAEEQKQKNILHCWISWLFSDIVIPVVRTYFYVTERESKRYDVFYYPKSVWRDLTSNAIASLNKKNFRILRGEPRKAVRHLNCSSRVRFLPKAKDMRPLVNLRAKSKDANLNKCHLIMKKLRDEKPEMFGSSVFDYNNVHQNLSQFISSKRSQLMKKLKVYIVVADVSKAFDCVSHDMVLKMIDDAFKCDEYTVRKCSKVICNRSKNSLYRFDSNASIGNGNSIYDLSIQLSSGGGIFVDQGTICRILKEQFHHLLYEQIKCNILKIGQKYYLQQVGIAQGSKLSPNLCSLYYGHLENSVLSKFLHDSKLNAGEAFSEPEYLLMRFIDDFIFISFSLEHAQKFLNRMRRGFVFYNCYMNDSKYGFNFCAGNSEPSSNRLYRGDDGVSFMPWSGLLINCETLEIQADYTRYMHSLIVRRMQDVELHYNVRPVLKLRRKETIWLGLTAYIRVLQQKQSRYKDMLTLLTAELGRYCHLGHECDTLRYAVDDSHSSMFWKFKF